MLQLTRASRPGHAPYHHHLKIFVTFLGPAPLTQAAVVTPLSTGNWHRWNCVGSCAGLRATVLIGAVSRASRRSTGATRDGCRRISLAAGCLNKSLDVGG